MRRSHGFSAIGSCVIGLVLAVGPVGLPELACWQGAGLAVAQSSAPERPVAGRVTFIAGSVHAGEGLLRRPLQAGAVIHPGDVLETGAGGHLHIKTVDDGFLALRPNSRALIELFEFNPAAPSATRIRLRLNAGAIRAVSGEGAQAARQNFRLNTPVAAIGIRGTDFAVSTTDSVTRALVNRGAIVVSAFDGDCRPEGLGPCGSEFARLLSGDQAGKFLELRQGQREPALIDIRTDPRAPDQGSPPAANEPPAKAAGERSGQLVPQGGAVHAQAGLEKEISSVRPLDASPEAPVASITPIAPVIPVIPVIPVTPAIPIDPPAATARWGRWQALAGEPASVSADGFVAANGPVVAINRLYLLSVAGAQYLQVPTTGVFSFRLEAAEAYLTNTAGPAPIPAVVQSAAFTVDFGRSRFSTSLSVGVLSDTYQLRSDGVIAADGRLSGNLIYADGVTNTSVRGSLAGAQADRAAYLFERAIDTRRALVGAASWRR